MFCIFFKSNGWVSFTMLPQGKTMDGDAYINDCLIPMTTEIKTQRPVSGTKNSIFHHDNARPHVHKRVKEYLQNEGYTVMKQPPYSPDLAPADFWLFDFIKRKLKNHSTQESLFDDIENILNQITKRDWSRTFQKWQDRMNLCIQNKGEYFEHLL
ncbi:hypothetical protein ABPG72_013357 [Tetrahymena utriculariae]